VVWPKKDPEGRRQPAGLSRRGTSRGVVSLAAVIVLTGIIAGTAAPLPPNIIFVLADDLGWAELGCYGNTFNETPNLDQLSDEGTRFTQAYAAAPVCSPYRAALLTGQYPARVGILDFLKPKDPPLSTNHVTIAEMLKRHGYATGMIGKWHLSGYRYHGAATEIRATDHGFDEELVTEIKGVGNGANFFPYVFRNQPVSWTSVREQRLPGSEYLTDRMNWEAIEFIQRHKDRPFFLYLSHFAPHTILNGRPDLVEKYRNKYPPGKSTRSKCYLCKDAGLVGDVGNHWAGDHNPHLAAMLESIDDGIGMILRTLDELGLSGNTIVVFTSDNGGEAPNVTSNAPLRGGKSHLYEGGIRVPLIIRWPGTISAGATFLQPTVNIDFYPTLIEAAGIEPDGEQFLDGISLLPALRDPSARIERDTIFWHYPLEKKHFLGGRSSGAIRQGEWKLIDFYDSGETELYNLADDISEQSNLAAVRPDVVTTLRAQLRKWQEEVAP